MNDEALVELHGKMEEVAKKDASYLSGFITVFEIFKKGYADTGTPIQNALLIYIEKELRDLYKIKSEHSQFKHIVK